MSGSAISGGDLVAGAVCALGAYLLGAIPVGYLIARSRGVDIRKVGSGNIGATNVFRSLGKGWGILTFAGDVAKGWLSVELLPWLLRELIGMELTPPWVLGLGALAIVGHNWPVYLGFQGGKGVATSVGVLLGVAPAAVGMGLVVWLAVFLAGRYVSLASICAAAAVAGVGWLLYLEQGWLIPTVLTLLAGLTIVRHKSNIVRLLRGTENRFGKPGHNGAPCSGAAN